MAPFLADVAFEFEGAVTDYKVATDERRFDLDALTTRQRGRGTVPAAHHAGIDLPAAADAAERDVGADLCGMLAGAEPRGRGVAQTTAGQRGSDRLFAMTTATAHPQAEPCAADIGPVGHERADRIVKQARGR